MVLVFQRVQHSTPVSMKHLLDTPVGNVELRVSFKNLESRAKPKLSMWDSLARGEFVTMKLGVLTRE